MGYSLNRLDGPVFMAGPKPMRNEFGIHQRLESCDSLNLKLYKKVKICFDQKQDIDKPVEEGGVQPNTTAASSIAGGTSTRSARCVSKALKPLCNFWLALRRLRIHHSLATR